MITIRKGNKNDLAQLQQLFVDTIHFVCHKDYNQKQIEAWSSGIENKERWQQVIHHQYILVATEQDKILGFCSLDNGNYIDLLFVHKNHQHQGIALQLYTLIEQEARQQNQKYLTADVSKTAQPFFEKIGFKLIKEQIVTVKGVELTNFKMKKDLI
ncbi:GNAT family N-acetyltransferase [Chryseobacterium polytrichastri]|uniref:Putative acetyltransferase n=1 Tax=Chryseobacterium polytrichastri TaxID=1302687 RepID=A0A1M6UDB6_9FLAO|nr:GNAT family N-acetyltransferase [Chryseobacterium polytrichastri]SHK67163.1 putative acetyltransferase [Chryseobacterium polytrichastri]